MLSASDLAGGYDRYVSARWRGDPGADDFAVWLESHWTGEAPPEPTDAPSAVSVLGGASPGIRWYERGGVVLGYAPGRPRGCYWVPMAATMPVVRGDWEIVPPPESALASATAH